MFQVIHCLTLRELAFFLAVLLKVTSVAELCDYKDIVAWAEGIDELDHVLVLDLLEDLDLGFDKLLQFGNLFHLALTENLDCVDLVGLGVDRLVDCAVWAATQFWEQVVLLDLFALEVLALVGHCVGFKGKFLEE